MAQASASILKIRCLGGLSITYEGEELAGSLLAKAQALLVYLALNPGPARRERLAGLFWGEMAEKKARANLRTTLSRLRRPLAAYLDVYHQAVAFDPAPGAWVDVLAFEQGLAAASPGARREAVALYQGDFLEGVAPRGAVLFEEWAVLERERLRLLLLDALGGLAKEAQTAGAYEQAIADLRHLLRLDPWREAAHRELMRALAAAGRRAAALAQYDRCRQTLADELGVEPAEATVAVYEAIWKEARTGQGAPTAAPPHNLPAPVTPFLGREQELAQIAQRLAGGGRLLTIVGPGGAGKTRLALEAARAQRGRFAGGVFLVRLAAVARPEQVAAAIGEALGFQFGGTEAPERQLLTYLRDRQLLLLLDNFEHLLAAAGLAGQILREAPEVQVLATSRQRLNLSGEGVVTLHGLPVPAPEEKAGSARPAAIRLFAERARRVRPNFRVDAEAWPHLVAICRRVAGLPLALELAAGWMELLDPADIAAAIGADVDFLASGARDLPSRQRSMRAVFDHSWRLLAEGERALLPKLAVFEGGFSRDAARAVAGASLAPLRALAAKSLLFRGEGGRYALHALLRRFALEKLAETPAVAEAVRDRHARYYAGLLQEHEVALWGGDLSGVALELDNVRAAWRHASARPLAGALRGALYGVFAIYEFRGLYAEAAEAFREAAARVAAEAPGGEQDALYGRLLVQAGAFTFHTGRLAEGRELIGRGQALLRARGAAAPLAWANAWAVWAGLPPDDEAAEALLRESLDLLEKAGSEWGKDLILLNLGFVAGRSGEYAAAERWLRRSEAVARAAGDRRGRAWALHGLGGIAWLQGALAAARAHYEQALALTRALGYAWSRGNVLTALALTTFDLEEYAAARAHYAEAATLYAELGVPRIRLRALHGLTLASLALGDREGAQRAFGEGLTLLAALGADPQVAAEVRSFLLRLPAYTAAAAREKYYRSLLQIGLEVDALTLYTPALAGLARLRAGAGDREGAVAWAALAAEHAPDEEAAAHAEGVLADLEGTLPAATFAAARDRGRQKELGIAVRALLQAYG